MLLLALVLTCAAVWLWVAPPRKGAMVRPSTAVTPRGALARMISRVGFVRPGMHRDEAALIGAALISVAARLRAGQSPRAAWAGAIATIPEPLAEQLRVVARAGRSDEQVSVPALKAAGAATKLAEELGADLAGVLDACAEGIEESARARADRNAAFAAPRATARVLLALPLIGVGIGGVMGARPWSVFTSSWWGVLIAVAGGVFLVLGRWWIHTLLNHASSAGGSHP